MIDLSVRLQAALGDAYQLERELGGGGMSRVFLATEASLRRKVVIKLLPPELTSEVSAARFQREIEVTAQLQHPNILSVLAAGSNDGLLYYVMPYVAGQSLQDRLAHEGRLPIEDAARIIYETADALAHAHGRGIIHRDIKPGNILLQDGHAVVTDFGVSRALEASQGGQPLTQTGMAVGTPGYMSPEQAAGERHIDVRADVYALAVVGYEMLAGRPPFDGPTAAAVLAAHMSRPPKPVRQLRPEVSQRLNAAIDTALAKDPDRRFQSAAEFRDAIGMQQGGVMKPARRGAYMVAAALVVATAAVATWLLPGRNVAPEVPLDPNLVAVLPFRVAGADPTLAYLREGMVDMLAPKLTGEGGPRAVDQRTMLAAWRRSGGGQDTDLDLGSALAVARSLGASSVILGDVVGSSTRIVLNASLVGVDGGITRTTSVEGPPDSLSSLIDRVTGQLLALEAGEGRRLAEITSASLPALRAYLDGQVAYRHGRYEDAVVQFGRALEIDSAFALAGLGLSAASYWGGDPSGNAFQHGQDVAWENQERLSVRDRAVLRGWAGPRYPNLATPAERFALWEEVVRTVPDQPDVWYWMGDEWFHLGPTLDVADWQARAARAFERAVALDSTFTAPIQHLMDLAADAGDVDRMLEWAERFLQVDSTADNAEYVRWRLAVARADGAPLPGLRDQYQSMSGPSILNIAGWMELHGIALDDAPIVWDLYLTRVLPSTVAPGFIQFGAADRSGWRPWAHLSNAGRPAEALAYAEARFDGRTVDALAVLGGVYGDGDTAVAGRAAERLQAALGPPAADSIERGVQYRTACTLARWYVATGDLDRVSALRARARAYASGQDREMPTPGSLCWLAIEALLAESTGDGEWVVLVERLDSLSATGGLTLIGEPTQVTPTLDLAWLFERAGDIPRARRAIARRQHHSGTIALLATHLREEGRLAALAGDTTAAAAAYSHYLGLRSDPEPSVAPAVERVRAELGRLVGEGR